MTTGAVHRIPVKYETSDEVERALRSGHTPFDRPWLIDVDGAFVRTDAIVSIYVELGDPPDEPPAASP